MGLTKLLSISAAKEVVAGWSLSDVDSGSVIGCILEVVDAIGIVVDDTKVMVVGILKLTEAVCSSITPVVIDGTTVLTSVISADVLVTMEANVFEFPRLVSTLEVVDMEGTKAVFTSADVLITVETNVFEILWLVSTLEVVDIVGTAAVGIVNDGMSISLIDIPLPSSPVIIPAVSGHIVVQLRSRSRQ